MLTCTDDILIDAIIAGEAHKTEQERLLDQGQDLYLAKTSRNTNFQTWSKTEV